MKLANSILFVSVLFCNSTLLSAQENFWSNWFSPIPPGCVSYYSSYLQLYPESDQQIILGDILLDGWLVDGEVTARLGVSRVGCAEKDRSFLRLDIIVPDDGDGVFEEGALPIFYARINGQDIRLRPTQEPNGWVSNESLNFLPERTIVSYILDVPTTMRSGFNGFISAEQYNSAFTLVIDSFSDSDYTAEIPAYNNELQPSFIPLNGRLSGLWVINGATDQGFVISFSEYPGKDDEGMIFFSWYTFDASGKNLWLVGNANYQNGAGQLEIELQTLTNGQFMGSKTADRINAGTIRLAARNCNLIELIYDLRAVGLGQGSKAITRLIGLETAGYVCRDEAARLK